MAQQTPWSRQRSVFSGIRPLFIQNKRGHTLLSLAPKVEAHATPLSKACVLRCVATRDDASSLATLCHHSRRCVITRDAASSLATLRYRCVITHDAASSLCRHSRCCVIAASSPTTLRHHSRRCVITRDAASSLRHHSRRCVITHDAASERNAALRTVPKTSAPAESATYP